MQALGEIKDPSLLAPERQVAAAHTGAEGGTVAMMAAAQIPRDKLAAA